jgi:hypothetical protein
MLERNDEYSIKLAELKLLLQKQKEICNSVDNKIISITNINNYEQCSSELEKNAISSLEVIISNSKQSLEQIIWE